MSKPNRFKEFEQKLAELKAQREAGDLSLEAYIAQAQELRFEDETSGKVWWLDPETEEWYVAPVGTNDFELASPQPGGAPPPAPEPGPASAPESAPLEGPGAPGIPLPEPKSETEPHGELPPGPASEQSFWNRYGKFVLWGGVG
ncbi:hypothetical protein D6833_12330, partial [Candidatus Parcubacteria bacterium]